MSTSSESSMTTGSGIRVRAAGSSVSCSLKANARPRRKSRVAPAPHDFLLRRWSERSSSCLSPDRSAVEAETGGRLRDLIRFDTTNPPGKELPAALYLKAALDDEGIATTLFEPDTNRAALIGRIRGTGASRP